MKERNSPLQNIPAIRYFTCIILQHINSPIEEVNDNDECTCGHYWAACCGHYWAACCGHYWAACCGHYWAACCGHYWAACCGHYWAACYIVCVY